MRIFRANFKFMNFTHFIAKRLNSSSEKNKTLPIVRIAIGGIILGMCIMLLSLFIVLGYRKAIQTKILGFSRHIDLVNYNNGESYQTYPIDQREIKQIIASEQEIQKQEPYGIIGGIATTEEETEAIILKGVNKDYNWNFLEQHLTSGKIPELGRQKVSDEILISETLSKRLELNIEDKLCTHFLLEKPRARVFKISGIYHTGISDFDQHFIIGDLRQIQRLYQWDSNQCTGIALTLKDFKRENN